MNKIGNLYYFLSLSQDVSVVFFIVITNLSLFLRKIALSIVLLRGDRLRQYCFVPCTTENSKLSSVDAY